MAPRTARSTPSASAADVADPRERIIHAAERLIGDRGIDVSLRDIAIAAGQRNNSAVQYYFGSRDGLIEAVIDHRALRIEDRRLERLAELEERGAADGVRDLVAALVEPLLESPRLDGATHYGRFLEQVRTHPSLADPASLDVENRGGVRLIMARLSRALGDLPARVRDLRLRSLASLMFALLADHERRAEAGNATLREERFEHDAIVDMLTAMLLAPVTDAATRRRSIKTRSRSAT
jgi:AcrR family transcriptional regulator